MPHRHHHRGGEERANDEAPSPRPSAAGCYAFLRSASSRRAGGGYRRLDSALALKDAEVRVEVGTTKRERRVFHVDPAVLDAGPVRRLVAAAGRRLAGGGVAVAVDALLFEHLLWLAKSTDGDVEGSGDGSAAGSDDDLTEIVEFYSHDDDDDDDEDLRF